MPTVPSPSSSDLAARAGVGVRVRAGYMSRSWVYGFTGSMSR